MYSTGTCDDFDRSGARRTDAVWLEDAWNDPNAHVLVFAGTRFMVTDRSVTWVPGTQAPEGTRVLLGVNADGPWFALFGPRDLDPGTGAWLGLREAFGWVKPAELSLLMQAVGLAEWHASHRHCPQCGGALEPQQAGHVLHCPDCGRDQFPRTDPAVIMLITDEDDRALLGRQPSWPEGRWSTLAGFVEPGETLEDAVRREVFEEAGVVVGEVNYSASQPWPLPASLMLGFTGRATSTEINVDGEEIQAARWFSREDALKGAEDGSLIIPPGISISRALITGWYGEDLPGSWT